MKKKSYFKLITLCMMLAVSSVAAAVSYSDYKYENMIIVEPACVPPVLLDGVYLGASLGYDHSSIRQEVDLINTNGNVAKRLSLSSPVETAFVGYGLYFDWFYIAGEIWISNDDGSVSDTLGSYSSTLSSHATYGAAILPGVKILPTTAVYLRLGASRASFKIKENDSARHLQSSSFAWGNGRVFGLGVETLLYKHISVRGEYTYTDLDSFNSELGTTYATGTNQVSLGIIYHIG